MTSVPLLILMVILGVWIWLRWLNRRGKAELVTIRAVALEATISGGIGAAFALAFSVVVPQWHGLTLALLPAITALGALSAWAPWKTERVPSRWRNRTASLTPRTIAGSLGVRRRKFVAQAVMATLVLGLVILGGVTSSPDSTDGLYRTFAWSQGQVSGATGPYLGRFYGVPLGILVILFNGAAVLALRTILNLPALDPNPEKDNTWRRVLARVAMYFMSAGNLGSLGVALFAVAPIFSPGLDHSLAHHFSAADLWIILFRLGGLGMLMIAGLMVVLALFHLFRLAFPRNGLITETLAENG